MAILRPARWVRPAFGAGPVNPFPADLLLRFGLFGLFGLYMATGANRDTRLSVAVAAVILAHAIAATVAFSRARDDERRLLATWGVILPADVLLILLAAYADPQEGSPIALLALAVVFTASTMFVARYVFGVAVLAAVGVVVSDAIKNGGSFELQAVFVGALVVFVAGFAANRSRSEATLRQQLTESETREREQSAALRSALEAARVSESRFQAISDHAPAILVLFDRAGNPMYASRSLEALLGLDTAALADELSKSTRLSQADRNSLRAAISGTLEGTSSSVEFSVRDANGDSRRISSTFFSLDGGGGAIGIDVTSERALTAQVARAQQMETLGTLAGGIAHDFNNLLTAILGNLFLIEQHLGPSSPLAPMVSDAHVAGERGAELVRQLLDYSRPNLESPQAVDLQRLVEETARMGQRGITPSIALVVEPCEAGAMVQGNFGALQQVLLNLMVNARDAMPDGGTLTISTGLREIDEEYVREHLDARSGTFRVIAVSDTGTGMSPETVARIFDPFFTTKEVGKGTGLGLATAQSILQAHGGWLDVESSEGAGSTFRIMLPAIRPGDDPAGPGQDQA